MPTQRKIASILSAYDNLIDTNRRRIQLLEESARLLFREWFVYFRFPGHEKVKIVDGVPEGWERLQVKDIIRTVNARKKLQKSEYDEAGLYPCVDQSQEFISGYSDRKDYVINNIIPIVIFGDHTRIIKYVAFPFVSGADGTQLLVSKHNKINSEFLYFILKNINLSNYFYARHFKFLKDQWILVPTEYLCSSFILFSKNIMKQISVLRSQTQKLA
ncbi:restriction endonuclease subunit S [bacterium]|nr:restriction endonuclease subunit S [bacterium]